jgi:ribosomal protein S12 methylthiotransferase accessory factor
MKTETLQRSVPTEVAIRIAFTELSRIGLSAVASQLTGGDYPVTQCVGRQASGKAIVSFGKGRRAQSLASALFELLETFHMTSSQSGRRQGPLRLLRAQDLAEQSALEPDLAIQRWARDHPHSMAAASSYTALDESVLWYPIFLCDPSYHLEPVPGDDASDYRDYLRYTSSIGTAAGVTAAEAELHALCELIEHDAFSLALITWFKRRELSSKVVQPGSFPPRLRNLWKIVEETTSGRTVLFDITSDIPVPTYLAVVQDDGLPAGILGLGTSPQPSYAAERALSEVLQTFASNSAGDGPEVPAPLRQWPVLHDCFRLATAGLMQTAKLVPLQSPRSYSLNVGAMLLDIQRNLAMHGFKVYRTTISPQESTIAVVTAVVPGLDRFSLVHLGIPVVPTGRGMSRWQSASFFE